MSKSPDAFRSIGEVSRLVGVAPHVLRYWESQFPQLAPVKRADGRRYYRPDDVRLVAGLCQVMREEGLSIRGARRLIADDRGAGLREIGAARLGETLGGSAVQPAPAVRLAVPAVTAHPAGHPPAPANAKPPRRAPKPPGALPLFDGIGPAAAPGWLARLVAAAAALRRRELQGGALPVETQELCATLRASR
ncbi:MerR HTH family regulatory protein [Paracoccus aminovorans]|uniref:MerR HTH family regulatory protein n=2 Tax=Paracoccus aminovorans TaxID=34004 RepID=A0A1I3AJG1_9RHOB|nr:MerR family transcriptional regulator [Paracoccus aminovorans]CQR86609.1 MerR family transcriptional regulator [Paracoccus aminovorans]SFH49461.1 MerR HTH family regulatory protein [Paracoccus aminovorans]